MYDKATNHLYMTMHTVPGRVLGDIEYTFNNVNGGVKKIEDFKSPFGENYTQTSFFGGNVGLLGLIKELGFHACISNKPDRKILGFYIDTGSTITEYGKEVLRKRFSDVAEIHWTGTPPKGITQDDVERRKTMIAEATKYGHSVTTLNKLNVAEMDGLLKAMQSGKRSDANITMEQPKVAPASEAMAKVRRRELSAE